MDSPLETALAPPRTRLGAVNYLNSRPLIETLGARLPSVEVRVDFPSRLADQLAAGTLDVALAPSIELFRRRNWVVVSDACVSADGPVGSVCLYSRRPIEKIDVLALDEGSRTSAALVQILLRERFGVRPRCVPLPIGATAADAPADAVMLIGDRGLSPAGGHFELAWDLGDEWTKWTGLPFVFAMWIARPSAATAELSAGLSAARDDGLGLLPQIARQAAEGLNVTAERCMSYLRDHLLFHLGPGQREALARFYDLAVRHDFAPPGAALTFR